MFSYLYNNYHKHNRLWVFLSLPIVLIINSLTHMFIGGILVICTMIAAMVLSRRMLVLYFVGDALLFFYSVVTNDMKPKVVAVQGTVFLVCVIIAAFAGHEAGSFIHEIEQKRKENCQLTTELIHSFVAAIDAKDHYLQNHSYNVAYYSRKMAEAMGYSPKDIERISLGAMFHDIGKLSVSEEILNKPGKLTEEEWKVMKGHPASGVAILHKIEQLDGIYDLIKYHHRHYDGTGYPDDCPLEDVPKEAGIIAVADAFDAMTSDRPYRKALPLETAYAELKKYRGSQFDPAVIDAFFKCELEPSQLEMVDVDLVTIVS